MTTGGDPLGEAARRGAQIVLQKALEMGVDDFPGRGRYKRREGTAVVGYRNGCEPGKVHLAKGTIELQAPQLRETLVQHCQVHKMRNILNKLPEVARVTLKKLAV